ncbi:hypothetical protein HMPREF3039_01469 [Akkermansia sp. KLE1798]|nr:hypothetical protein HMPREF3039_01469 [Akkermansia sp. KLE1798]
MLDGAWRYSPWGALLAVMAVKNGMPQVLPCPGTYPCGRVALFLHGPVTVQ